MKIIVRRELSLTQLRQCLFEQFIFIEDRYAIRHSRNITLYMTTTNGQGEEVVCRDWRGEDVTTIHAGGPYPCAADRYDF